MKNIKSTLQIITFSLIFTQQISLATDTPQQNRSQAIMTSEQGDYLETELTSLELEKIRLFQEEIFDGIKSQSNTILYSLQQIEQVLIANKVKFDETKISKKELLQEIKIIKSIIENIYSHYHCIPASQGIVTCMILNKGFIEYLLTCINKDITMFNSNKFEDFAYDMLNPESKWLKNLNLESEEDFEKITTENEANCLILIDAVENFGLTTFNKAFRYFQDQPISLTGKPLMSTCQYAMLYTSLAAIICGAAIYTAPKTYIPEYLAPIKEFIGDLATVGKSRNNNTEIKEISLGLYGSIDAIMRDFSQKEGLIASIIGLATLKGQEIYDWTLQKSNIAYKKSINYLRGEVDKTTNSPFESQTQDVFFHDMIGAEHLEKLAQEIADYIKHPRRYENSGISPEKGILLTGPSQTGKSYFAQALKTLIEGEAGQNGENIKFMYVTQDLIWQYGLDAIFEHARQNAPYILFIDEIDMIGTRRDKNGKTTGDLMTNMSGLNNDKGKKVIVIAATNRPEQLDFALLQDGRFGTQIRFEKPTYEHRKQHLIKTLVKRNITTLSYEYIDAIAQETEGCTFNTLDKIIVNALKLAIQQSRPVTARDFEESLDYNFRQIRTNIAMNDKEKEIVSVYHAGQAAARHILSTIQKVVKITIHAVDKPVKGKEGFALETNTAENKGQNIEHIQDERIRSIKLGNVFTLNTTNNNQELISDDDQENELLALLAGQAALELIKGQTYHNFGQEDRAKILHILETKISQGGAVNDQIRKEALAQKDILNKKIKTILAPHTTLIKTITDALLDHSTIDKYEWENITQNYKIYNDL